MDVQDNTNVYEALEYMKVQVRSQSLFWRKNWKLMLSNLIVNAKSTCLFQKFREQTWRSGSSWRHKSDVLCFVSTQMFAWKFRIQEAQKRPGQRMTASPSVSPARVRGAENPGILLSFRFPAARHPIKLESSSRLLTKWKLHKKG